MVSLKKSSLLHCIFNLWLKFYIGFLKHAKEGIREVPGKCLSWFISLLRQSYLSWLVVVDLPYTLSVLPHCFMG